MAINTKIYIGWRDPQWKLTFIHKLQHDKKPCYKVSKPMLYLFF